MQRMVSVSNLSWLAAALVAVSGILGAWLAGSGSMALAVLAVSACAAAAAGVAFLAGSNAKAAARLAEAVKRYAEGKYDAKFSAEAAGGDADFLEMARQVERAVGRLKSDLGFTRGVLLGMATPCVVVDREEVLRFTNKNLLRILEHTGNPEDFYGQNVAHFFYGDATRQTVLGTALRERKEITKEVELVGRRGGKRHIRIDASPLYDLEGELMGSLCVYADLTDLRAHEAKLVEINRTIATIAEKADASSEQVASAARELAGLVDKSRSGAGHQSERMEDTVAAMEEMNASVLQVARNASHAAESSDNAKRKAQEGAAIVGQVVQGIGEVQVQAQGLKTDMDVLGRQAAGIGQILDVISDIADQTNLLALNAAIEAARAGEAGRGFAVVADEVRKLAEKTQAATKEVGDAIHGIQDGTQKNVAHVDRAVKTIEQATGQARKSGEALNEIVAMIDETSGQVRSIATASDRESASAEQIKLSMDEVNAISSDTAQAMTQAARQVSELANQAQVLHDLIARMQAGGDEPRAALAAS